MNIYQEELMDHYEHPRNQGELLGEGVVTARDSNASCGDLIQMWLKVEKDKVVEVKWKGVGCAVTVATASKLSEWLKGKNVKEVKEMSLEELLKESVGWEVSPGRIKCLELPVKVMKKACEILVRKV